LQLIPSAPATGGVSFNGADTSKEWRDDGPLHELPVKKARLFKSEARRR